MSKRVAQETQAPLPKRQKIEQRDDPTTIPTVTNSSQLRQLLAFQQDAIPDLRKGIAAFKSFLDSFRALESKPSASKQTAILKEYLESQSYDETCLYDILQTWSYAGQMNNDGLLSAVPSVLAQLLKTISSLIEFRELGSKICKALLQQTQLKLFSRCLAYPKHKEHVIAPCLRLLTEVVSFDGGVFAKKVYAARSFLLDVKAFSRNLGLWRYDPEINDEVKSKPSTRLNALRLALALFKHLPSPLKGELLKTHQLVRSIFEHCKHDHPGILKETFNFVKTNICSDGAVPRSIKSQAFNESNLCNIAAIFRPDQENVHQGAIPVAKEFLTYLCTDLQAGVLRPSGWYPLGTGRSESGQDGEGGLTSQIGLDAIDSVNQLRSNIPIRNVTLSKFAQYLRPYASLTENELLTNIFAAAPELVADYFVRKSGFTFDPKLTSTWMGYAAFLFSTVRLSPPRYLGAQDDGYSSAPPPISIALDNIVPQPLSQKVLTRCLNQQHGLITLFTIRIMVASLEKLRAIIDQYTQAAAEVGLIWQEALNNLKLLVFARYPTLRELVTVLKKTPKGYPMQYEAILRLLKLYIELFPRAAFEEKLDMSQPLADSIKGLSDGAEANATSAAGKTSFIELTHLLQIAKWTPEMKWWNRVESLGMSPFTSLLRLLATTTNSNVLGDVRQLFASVSSSHQLLQSSTKVPAVESLISSLKAEDDFSPSKELFEFLDGAFARTVRKPIKYMDYYDTLVEDKTPSAPISLLWMTLAEQWPHAVSRPGASNIGQWLGRFVAASKGIDEDVEVLDKILGLLKKASGKHAKTISRAAKHFKLSDPITEPHSNPSSIKQSTDGIDAANKTLASNAHIFEPSSTWQPSTRLIDIPSPPVPEKDLHRALSKPIEDAITDGDLGALILCLSSTYPEVAKQAHLNLQQLMQRLSPSATGSSFADSREIYLLLGILTNTSKDLLPKSLSASSSSADSTPIPFTLTAYAAAAVHILTQPLHPLYSSIARFHTKAPKWDIARLPTYWLRKILGESPDIDDGNASLTIPSASSWSDPFAQPPFVTDLEEIQRLHVHRTERARPNQSTRNPRIQFFLSYILASLRSEEDVHILRRKGVFEPLFTLVSDSTIPRYLKNDVLKIVWRSTCIDGGSTMLITRNGVLSWLTMLLNFTPPVTKRGKSFGEGDLLSAPALKALRRRVWETCDQEYVRAWDKGGTLDVIDELSAA